MKYQISNSFLDITIDSLGAEILSIKDQNTKTEYLWQADKNIWARHAPILFPIVGKLKDDQYNYDGKTYHMTQHGFARDREFEVVNQDKNKISLALKSDEKTLEMFPFKFELVVQYTLLNNMVEVNFVVKNLDDKTMIFGIGGHPGFNLAIDQDTKKHNYFFRFEPAKSRVRIPLVGSNIDVKNRTLAATDASIEISDNLFENDALIFELNSKTKISLRNDQNDYHINMILDQTPFVGLWSPYPKIANFVCIEPWWGIADDVNSNGKIEDKIGMNKLASGQTFTSGYQMSFHDKKTD